jgi:hypothetical protein
MVMFLLKFGQLFVVNIFDVHRLFTLNKNETK